MAPKEPPPITASGSLYLKPRNGVQALRPKEVGLWDAEGKRKAAVAARKRAGVMKCTEAMIAGGLALALRYADIIILADKMMNSVAPVEQEMRHTLYSLLLASLQSMVNAKIKKCLECEDSWSNDELMAEGWREVMGQILGSDMWLAPFGSGRRSCPGKALGLTTVNFWVASLLHGIVWAPSVDGVNLG